MGAEPPVLGYFCNFSMKITHFYAYFSQSSHFKAIHQLIACYMIKAKVAFLEGRLFSGQSELFENFSDCSDWLDKSRPSKNATFVLIM